MKSSTGLVNGRRLYVSDLDGTLLDGQARLSAFSRASLTRLLRAGVAFTVATARSVQAVRVILGDLPLSLPIVEQNGACVTDLTSGRRWAIMDIPADVAKRIFAAFREHRAEPIVACQMRDEDQLWFETPSNPGTCWYIDEKQQARDPRLRPTLDAASSLQGRVLSVTTLTTEPAARALAQTLSADLGSRVQVRLAHNAYVPGWWELSVLDANANKSAAVRALRKRLDVEDAELVVFGDGENDIDLFRGADVAVAVENAVPELRALATQIVPDNESDGVARFLLEQHAGEL